MKISETNECGLCKQAPETIVHLFTQCNKSNELWENIVKWIKNKIGIDIVLSNTHKILGYLTMDAKFWPINLILLVTRKYLYSYSRKGYTKSIFHVQKEIKKIYTEQHLFHCLNSFNNNFSRKWVEWNIIFTGIDD